jgi:hypothetical protein
MNEWKELSQFVKENWDYLYFNAQLLEGETESLGVTIGCVEADYYAPERIWVHFANKKDPCGKKMHVELHQEIGVKYVNGIRNYSTEKNKFTPKQIMGVNLEVARRTLCILGMKREEIVGK